MIKDNGEGNIFGRLMALAVLSGFLFYLYRLCGPDVFLSCSESKLAPSEAVVGDGENLRDALSDAVRR